MSNEVWKDIPGFYGYQASSLGRIRSRLGSRNSEWRFRKSRKDHSGYLRVCLTVDTRKQRCMAVHRLVLMAHVGLPDPPTLFGLHINGDRLDNRAGNLKWGTAKENADDRERHGTTAKREAVGNAKLTMEIAEEIRRVWNDTSLTNSEISKKFGVSRRTIGRVVNNKLWTEA